MHSLARSIYDDHPKARLAEIKVRVGEPGLHIA